MRKPMMAGNWKMYKDEKEAIELANGIMRAVYDVENVDIVVCPPSIDLSEVSDVITDSNISLGAQNMHWEKEGAYTGEISAAMLKSVGCEYVIIGHSERRKYFLETDEIVNKKVKAAIDNGLIPIMCVGETLEEREANKTLDVVSTQVKGGLKGLSEDFIKTLIIAYEPVWAIGTGKTATPQQAQEVHAMIRKLIKEMYSKNLSDIITILYGGSAKPDNIETLMKEADIDGGLIGGASLKAESFAEMVKTTSRLYAK